MNSSEGEGDEGFAEEPAGDADGGESVGEGADLADVKITTESGNEVSMQDIKIVQNLAIRQQNLFLLFSCLFFRLFNNNAYFALAIYCQTMLNLKEEKNRHAKIV